MSKKQKKLDRRKFGSRCFFYGGALILTALAPLTVETIQQIDSRTIREIDNSRYEKPSIEDLANNSQSYKGRLVEISGTNIFRISYFKEDKTQHFYETLDNLLLSPEERIGLRNELQIRLQPSEKPLDQKGFTYCKFKSNGATREYKLINSVLKKKGDYKGPMIIRGRADTDKRWGTPVIHGHSIELTDPDTGNPAKYNLSNPYD